eukprot:17319-Heterococcus_DN1.PRE.1
MQPASLSTASEASPEVAAAEFTNTAYARSGSIAQEKVNSIQARCVGVLHSDRCTSESDLNSKALIMLPACRLAAKHTFTSATRCTVTAQFAVRKVALFSTAQTDAAIPAPAATSRASPFKDAGLFGVGRAKTLGIEALYRACTIAAARK